MNKTGIEWCDYTTNPVTGCKHGCPYCYARKIAERFRGSKAWPQGFEPMFHTERLQDPAKMKKPQTIFVCSMADLFGDWVPEQWIQEVLYACHDAPQHTYIFLTKNPERYLTIPVGLFRSNMWFGTSSDGGLHVSDRIRALQKLPHDNKFISFEPLLYDPGLMSLKGIKQVIIGAQTNPDKCAGLEAFFITCEAADHAGAKVFMKDSLAGRWPDRELRRELCWTVNK